MKRLCSISVAVALMVSSLAYSDSATEREAEKLFGLMGMQSAFEGSISQMLDLQLQQNPALTPYKGVMLTFFSKYMSYESLKPDLVRIYVDAFTASELQQINAFYQTEAGRKAIEKMPELMAKGGELGAGRVRENAHELQAMIRAESERIQKLQQQQ